MKSQKLMRTGNSKKLKVYQVLSVLVTLIGIALMVFMITAESEPGAIPLLLTIAGAGWYFFTRLKIRSQHGTG
jgi:hypothetical protein